MEIKKKKIDIIKNIDTKKNIIKKDVKLIDNVFFNKLYRNYILSHRKKKKPNIFEIISEKPENKKIAEKIIINSIIKKIPPNLLQYFSQFEFKNYANKLILSSTIKKSKKNKSSSPYKQNSKIYSRNKSSSYRLNTHSSSHHNNTYNDGDKNNYIELDTKKLFDKKIKNQKEYILLSATRKNSANIMRNNYIKNNDSVRKGTFDNKINNNSLNFNININKRIYNSMSSKKNVMKTSIFNRNKSDNNLTDDITIIKKPKSSKNALKSTYDNYDTNNIEKNKSNKINNYNYVKKDNIQKKLFLNLSNSNDKTEKKFYSRVSLNNNIIKKNLFILPKKKQKIEILNSFSPEEKNIIEKAANISNNLKEIKREIKTERLEKPKNVKYIINQIKKEKDKEVQYIKSEVSKTKCYEYFMKNKKYMQNKKEIFKVLRNSFNTERMRRNTNESTFIKTLNIICDEEKQFDNVLKQVYKQNYWLRYNKNKKNAENIKIRIDNMNSKSIQLNMLINKINKINIKTNNT